VTVYEAVRAETDAAAKVAIDLRDRRVADARLARVETSEEVG
jgi:hypothetical protein